MTEKSEIRMPERIDDTPENIVRRVMAFHAPEGKYPYSEDGKWPDEDGGWQHEIAHEEAE